MRLATHQTPKPDLRNHADNPQTVGNNHALGILGWMAMIGDTHNRLSTSEFLEKLRDTLGSGQMEVFEREHKPIAWMIWRRPTLASWPALLSSFDQSQDTAPWQEGRVWLDFWVRPFGCDARLAHMLGERLIQHDLIDPRICWHDPSVNGGTGQLHLDLTPVELKGM